MCVCSVGGGGWSCPSGPPRRIPQIVRERVFFLPFHPSPSLPLPYPVLSCPAHQAVPSLATAHHHHHLFLSLSLSTIRSLANHYISYFFPELPALSLSLPPSSMVLIISFHPFISLVKFLLIFLNSSFSSIWFVSKRLFDIPD